MRVTVSYGGAAPTEAQQFATGAFFEFFVSAVSVHPLTVVYVVDMFTEHVAHLALEAAAGHYPARRQNRHVAVPTMATVVNRIVVQPFGNLEQSFLIEKECPQVIFKIERRTGILVLLEFPPDALQKVAVLQRLDVGTLLEASRAVTPEGENIDMVCDDKVDDVGYLPDIRSRNGRHHDAADTCPANDGDFFDGRIERARFADGIVRLAHPVDGELVLVAAVFFQPSAHFIGQMKRVAEYGKGNIPLLKQRENIPKTAMQDRIAARDVEIGQAFHTTAHFHAIVHHLLRPTERHFH